MKSPVSIRTRLTVGGAVLLVAFLVGAGLAVQRAHENSVRTAHFARLQSTVYLLLAAAEIRPDGRLEMPAALAEPRLTVPGSGLYASISHSETGQAWQSESTLGSDPPFRHEQAVGQWRYETMDTDNGHNYLAASYGVRWNSAGRDATLVLSVLEDRVQFERELSVFGRTLWSWLGGAALLLLLAQTVLLRWALSPLRRIAREIRRIEAGEQERIDEAYPRELLPLTANVNALIQQERVRQTRYKEALSYLAHSLKTPLAVLRTGLRDPASLPQAVEQQVARMDDIVLHQLGRAAALGASAFVPPLRLAPVLQRIQASLDKVHAERQLQFHIECLDTLQWRIDEGDAFELLGNLLDNAAKWAKKRIEVRVARDAQGLHIGVADDGAGFSDARRVPQMFVRGDERVPGHGVGLAMVKDLVDSHGGKLRLGRSALGGAQVDIDLPEQDLARGDG